ncbi:helicase, partial [Nodularia sp. UHCC 0506]|nr:helicase [Nodularia sp. UHCC 0506]
VSHINWDDRGKAFAVWRTDESWNATEGKEWFGFRFNFVVETHLEAVKQVLTTHKLDNSQLKTLKRRVDALFPPMLETIFVDGRTNPMSLVEDKSLLNILQRPYKDRSSERVRDFNLAKERLGIIDNFVDISDWKSFCNQARSRSGELLLNNPKFIKMHEQYAQVAEQNLNKKVAQLKLRLKRQNEDSALAEELQIESALSTAILDGIHRPQIRLDSVGFIVVSGRNPL